MMRVVAIGDSLALPRSDPQDVVRWEETWPYQLNCLLRESAIDAEVINCGSRRRTVDTLVSGFEEDVVLKRPDVVILQVGVVDCAPRVISRRLRKMMAFLPPKLRERIIRRRSANRVRIIERDPLRRVYTKPDSFSEFLSGLIVRLEALDRQPRVIVLPIIGDAALMERKSPGFGANVELYNGLWMRFCEAAGAIWVSPDEIVGGTHRTDFLCADGVHLTPKGNHRVASVLVGRILVRSKPIDSLWTPPDSVDG